MIEKYLSIGFALATTAILGEPPGLTSSDPVSDAVDRALVQRVQRGDKKAFDLLVRKYQHRVTALAGRYLKEPADAMDVAQETFIKAYRALPNFRGDSAFYTWLFRITVNTAKNYLDSRARKSADYEIDHQDAEQFSATTRLIDNDTPEHLLLTEEIARVVHNTIAGLPGELRTAITLREFDGLSYKAIGTVMDCPVGTVRSRIFRAREAIDKKLRPLLDE